MSIAQGEVSGSDDSDYNYGEGDSSETGSAREKRRDPEAEKRERQRVALAALSQAERSALDSQFRAEVIKDVYYAINSGEREVMVSAKVRREAERLFNERSASEQEALRAAHPVCELAPATYFRAF
jgi:hypothetical protein